MQCVLRVSAILATESAVPFSFTMDKVENVFVVPEQHITVKQWNLSKQLQLLFHLTLQP